MLKTTISVNDYKIKKTLFVYDQYNSGCIKKF